MQWLKCSNSLLALFTNCCLHQSLRTKMMGNRVKVEQTFKISVHTFTNLCLFVCVKETHLIGCIFTVFYLFCLFLHMVNNIYNLVLWPWWLANIHFNLAIINPHAACVRKVIRRAVKARIKPGITCINFKHMKYELQMITDAQSTLSTLSTLSTSSSCSFCFST